MKKLIGLLSLICLCVLAACGGKTTKTTTTTTTAAPTTQAPTTVTTTQTTTVAENSGLTKAYEMVKALYKDAAVSTPADFTRVSQVKIGKVTYSVVWTAEVVDGQPTDVVVTKAADKAVYNIDVNEKTLTVVTYKLTATISDPESEETVTLEYEHSIPEYKVSTYVDFAVLEDDSNVVVSGVVTGVLSKTYGDASNGLYVNDVDGGYYVYNLANDPVTTGIEVGETVIITGKKDTYNGTLEIVDATVEVLDVDKVELEVADYTEAYAAATQLTDESLVGKQAFLVTVKGVTLQAQSADDISGGYYRFELNGLSSYIRISSSVCPLTAEEVEVFKASHKAGYIADVTGVVCVYNGAFYLTPVSVDAISNAKLPEKSDSEKVAYEKENLTFVENITENGSIVLPSVGATFETVTITWEVTEGTCAVIENGNLVVTLPEDSTDIKLKATITIGGVTETKEFSVLVDGASSSVFVAKPITAPAAGTVILSMDLSATNEGVRYFDGTIDSKGGLVTTDKIEKAADVVIEVVEGGYALKVGDKYLEGYLNGTYKNIRFADTAAVWKWNEEAKVFTCDIEGTDYYFGTYLKDGKARQYNMSLSATSYITGGNLSNIGVSQFVGKACTKAPAKYKEVAITAPAAGTVILSMDLSATNEGVRYFDGTIDSKGGLVTTDKIEKAADVVIEVVEGGYALKVGDKYLEGYLNGTYKNIRFADTAAVWKWNEEAKVFTCDIEGTDYYFGTYLKDGKARQYNMSLSATSYITGGNLSNIGVSQFIGQMCVIDFISEEVEVELTDAEKVAADLESIKVAEQTTGNLTLPTQGDNGSTISWSSSNTAIIANDGTVVRPAVGEEDATVTLTVTATLGDVTETKTYTVIVTALVAEGAVKATFDFGANGTANHVDGTDIGSTKTYTENGYELTLTNVSKVYGGAYDQTGTSALKFGTSSVIGEATFTVADDVNEVVIYVAKYKAKDTIVTVNGTQYTITTSSNDGEYTAITIDTSTTKTIKFATVSGKTRCLVDKIVFK